MQLTLFSLRLVMIYELGNIPQIMNHFRWLQTILDIHFYPLTVAIKGTKS